MCPIIVHVPDTAHHVVGVKPQPFYFEGKHIVEGVVCHILPSCVT